MKDLVLKPLYHVAAAAAQSLQSCPTVCDPTDGSPPGFAIPEILQARTLVGCYFLLQCMKVKVAQSCLTLSNPMDCSLPGSSVQGIFQARVLEWAAIAFPLPYLTINGQVPKSSNGNLLCQPLPHTNPQSLTHTSVTKAWIRETDLRALPPVTMKCFLKFWCYSIGFYVHPLTW